VETPIVECNFELKSSRRFNMNKIFAIVFTLMNEEYNYLAGGKNLSLITLLADKDAMSLVVE
jgi:hypothetical protein